MATPKLTTVQILVDGAFVGVDGYAFSPTWAVTREFEGVRWTITHVPTGLGLSSRFTTRSRARALSVCARVVAEFPLFTLADKASMPQLATLLANAP